MRKTTTSLAIFCSAVAVGVGVMSASAGCGKRGDPLPPLRPFPDAAEGLTIRQIGSRIELEWRAPTRNTDGTTAKLELAEVEVRRRNIDIAALVEAQTEVIDPPEPEPEPEPKKNAEPEDPETEEPEPETDQRPVTEPSEPSPPEPPVPAVPAVPPVNDAPILEEPFLETPETPLVDEPEEPEEPEAPPVPVLKIPDFAPESRYVVTLESTEPGERTTFDEEVDPTWIGKRLEYAIVYINRSSRRGQRTTTVQIEPVATMVIPERPVAEAGDGYVLVRWDRPEPDGHVSVFRRRESAPDYPDSPLNAAPIAETEFRDRSVTFDVSSCYVVRTVSPPPPPPVDSNSGAVEEEATLEPEPELEPEDSPIIIVPVVPLLKNTARIESVASPELCLVPVDTFAPPAPTGLVAVRSGEDVLLTWSEVERVDVTGYRVYRAESEGGPFVLLTEDVLRVPSYSDDPAASGQTYYYAVTAVDDAPAVNESERSELSEVTFTR